MDTHYTTLGVTRLSSAISIKQAYRRIALNSHPDKVAPEGREEATRRFQEVQVAYDVLSDPLKRRDYDARTFGQPTPPGSFSERDEGRQSWSPGREMPPTPESPGWGTRNGFGGRHSSWHSNDSGFRQQFSAQDLPKHVMTFTEATLLFHPGDRRHLWLCNEEDDPAGFGGQQIFKPLHVSLQEIFSRATVELSIFRYRYLSETTKVVELIRRTIKLKPFVSDVAATIDLDDIGNEFPPTSHSQSSYKQRLSITPVDESALYGDNYDGQFFRDGSQYNVAVHHTIDKNSVRLRKGLWWFELDIPALNGQMVIARFKGRLRKGRFTAVLKGEGMWKYYEGGERGDLHVRMDVT